MFTLIKKRERVCVCVGGVFTLLTCCENLVSNQSLPLLGEHRVVVLLSLKSVCLLRNKSLIVRLMVVTIKSQILTKLLCICNIE